MVLLESEQFLTELTRLFQKCRTSGSVFITLKKYDGRTKPVPRKGHVESFEPADNKCLLRATDGKKKISTVRNHMVAKHTTEAGMLKCYT
ncbi:signal recognition particle 14 kDa protein isoform 3-T3 [Alca torda]